MLAWTAGWMLENQDLYEQGGRQAGLRIESSIARARSAEQSELSSEIQSVKKIFDCESAQHEAIGAFFLKYIFYGDVLVSTGFLKPEKRAARDASNSKPKYKR